MVHCPALFNGIGQVNNLLGSQIPFLVLLNHFGSGTTELIFGHYMHRIEVLLITKFQKIRPRKILHVKKNHRRNVLLK